MSRSACVTVLCTLVATGSLCAPASAASRVPFHAAPASILSSALRSEDSHSALFVLSGGGLLSEYGCDGQLLGQMTINDTRGIALCGARDHVSVLDPAEGSEYIAQSQVVKSFRIGSKRADREANPAKASGGSYGVNCSVSPVTLVLAIIGNYQLSYTVGNALEYMPGARHPFYQGEMWNTYDELFAGAYGADGNLWVASAFPPAVASQAGNWHMCGIPVANYSDLLFGLAVDSHNNVLVEDSTQQTLIVVPQRYFVGDCSSTRAHLHRHALGFAIRLIGTGFPTDVVITPSSSEIFTIDGGTVYGYRYPVGGRPIVTLPVGAAGITVADKRPLL